MIKNYFLIAWRNLWKNKTFSFINIFGLSAGLAVCILMFLFIQHELSYDQYNANASRIFRLTSEWQNPTGINKLANTPAPWAPLMKKDYPEVLNYVRLLKSEKSVIGRPDQQQFYENNLMFADSTFFEIFSLKLIKGNAKLALERPNTAVLTRAAAKKYFGDEDPIGKILRINSFMGNQDMEVTAVVEEVPTTSHYKFDVLASLQSLGDLSNFWAFHMFHSYVLLNNAGSSNTLETKFKSFVDKYIVGNKQADGKCDIHLQPLSSIHLYSDMGGEMQANGDIKYVYIFGGIALFILLIACFNFTNLSTVRSLNRAKEVGLRKVIGAGKFQLIRQFFSESILFAIIALIIAIVLAILILPVFNQLSGRSLSFDIGNNTLLLLVSFLLALFVGVVAGFYPAIVLSSFKPIEILKGKFRNTTKGISIRKALITLQFVISISLIASTIIVSSQLHYLQNKSLGFDKENVAIISLPKDNDTLRIQTFKNLLINTGYITKAATASSIPGTNIPVNQVNDGAADLSKAISMQMLFADHDFASTMNFKILAGRDFSSSYGTDRWEGFIINETAVQKAGWNSPAEAIGKTFQWVIPDRVLKSGKVIGVVQDFNINPLKSAVQPLVIHYLPNRFQYVYAKFNQQKVTETIAGIEKAFKEVYPKQSFEYNFLDDTLNNMYQSERKTGQVFTYFSFLAILIASLGILGLSLYSIQQRVREIGVKKVLGAGVSRITFELVKDFVKPVFIAAIVATPVAWFAMNKWLEEFAYRISIQWWVFISAAFIACLVALLTVGFQAIKAAIANPVKALRSE